MRRVALMHSNRELADLLIDCIERYAGGWAAECVESELDTLAHIRALDRAYQCATDGYDVIQVDTLVGPGPPAQLASWSSGTPVVGYLRGWGDYTNAHGQYRWRKRNRIRAKTRIQLRTMDGLGAISHALVAGMSDMYPTGNLEVVERPYDIDRFRGGKPMFDDDRRRVLTTTNLRYAEKADGVVTMLRAMAPLLEADPGLEYIIAGGGRHTDRIRSAVERNPASDQIRFLGYVDDVPGLLASANVFAYVSWLDGAPSTVYEAQAAGLPVVGGDSAGVPEAVGDAGIVCPPTPSGMRDGIHAVLEDDSLRRELAADSKQKMATHNREVTQDWISFYEAARG